MADLLLTTIPELSEQTVLNTAYFVPVGIVGSTQKLSLQTLKVALFTDTGLLGVPTTTLPLIGDDSDRVASTKWVGQKLGAAGLGLATASTSGSVRTNSTDPVPTVYLKSEVDAIAASVRAIAAGGTGGATATAARSNLSAAQSGINSDITAINSLNIIPGIISSALAALVPPGSVIQFAGTVAPNGWMLCDGSEFIKTTAPLLAAVLGNTHGAPTDSSKCKLPDFRDRSAAGAGISPFTATTKAIGSKSGALSVTQDKTNLPSHDHSATTGTAGTHLHAIRYVGVQAGTANYVVDAQANASPLGTLNAGVTDPTPIHSHYIAPDGQGLPIYTQSPMIYVNFIIKT